MHANLFVPVFVGRSDFGPQVRFDFVDGGFYVVF